MTGDTSRRGNDGEQPLPLPAEVSVMREGKRVGGTPCASHARVLDLTMAAGFTSLGVRAVWF